MNDDFNSKLQEILNGVANEYSGGGYAEYVEKPMVVHEAQQAIISLIKSEEHKRETELLDSLYWMYVQYCSGKSGHMFMGAGETASELLEDAGYVVVGTMGEILKDNGDSYDQEKRAILGGDGGKKK